MDAAVLNGRFDRKSLIGTVAIRSVACQEQPRTVACFIVATRPNFGASTVVQPLVTRRSDFCLVTLRDANIVENATPILRYLTCRWRGCWRG